MKNCFIVCVLVAVVYARPEHRYTDRYDNVDLDEILSNDKLLIPYIKCVLDEGRCTADAKELKSHIKEALEDHCAMCTEAQKSGTRRVFGHLINREPGYWKQLTNKYDKDGKYSIKYESELKTLKA